MKDGATKEFVQAYNAQAAVDSHAQVIVGAAVTQEANDKKQLVPMLKEVKAQMGCLPRQVTADNGYFSEANVSYAQLQEIDLFVAPDGQNHGEKPPPTTGPPPSGASVAEQMRHKLRTAEGQAIYKLRKAVVEPVFGQIKEARGFRIPAARAGESAGGMADDLRHAQPAETLPLRMEPPEGLKALAQPANLVLPAARTVPLAQHPTLGDRESAKGRILEPYLRRAPRVKPPA